MENIENILAEVGLYLDEKEKKIAAESIKELFEAPESDGRLY